MWERPLCPRLVPHFRSLGSEGWGWSAPLLEKGSGRALPLLESSRRESPRCLVGGEVALTLLAERPDPFGAAVDRITAPGQTELRETVKSQDVVSPRRPASTPRPPKFRTFQGTGHRLPPGRSTVF